MSALHTWPPDPYKSRSEYLKHVFHEVYRFWQRLEVVENAESNMESLRDEIARSPQQKITLLDPVARELENLKNLLSRSFSIPKFGILNRACWDVFFSNLEAADFKEFFPVGMLFMDFDRVKQLNVLCGYGETDKVIAAGIDVLLSVIRSHRFQFGDRRTLIDLPFQIYSGDEIGIVLPRAGTIEECQAVEDRCHQALSQMNPVPIETKKGTPFEFRPSVTSTVYVMQDLQENLDEILYQAFEVEIPGKKAQKQSGGG